MTTRIFRYPATPMLGIILIYAFVAVPSAERARTLAMLSMTAIGAAELLLAIIAIIKERGVGSARVISHLCLAVAGGAIGFSLLEPMKALVFALGGLLFVAGVLIQLRPEADPSLDR